MKNDVYITGAGIVSALGSGCKIHLDALKSGRSGIEQHNFFSGELPDPCVCGKVPHTVIAETIDETAPDRAAILAENAFCQAIKSAGHENLSDTDLITGTTLGNMHGGTLYFNALKKGSRADTDLVKNVMPDSIGNTLAKKYHIKGKHISVSSACASGSTAIGTAYNRIMRGQNSIAVAGGVDALSPFIIAGFNCLRLLSKNVCRPFSLVRDGLNPGEGAAFVVLESYEKMARRKAEPIAKIKGFGTALEAFHYTRSHPDGIGIASAIRKALDNAGVTPEQIDHIHAHGTATVQNDLSEYNGYYAVFGDRLSEIPVCSTKSMTGHTYGAAGAISVVLSILTINNSIIPATLFCNDPDPLFTKINVSIHPRNHDVKLVLIVAVGFGGEVAALVLEAL